MPISEVLSSITLGVQSIITSLIPSTFFQFVRAPLLSVLRVMLMLSMSDSPYQFRNSPVRDAYDFVVVGAGSAGCVVASRLASGGASVLLLEAGGSAPHETAVPGLWPLPLGSDVDWYYRLAAHRFSQLGYMGNASFISQGKMMGGSSSLGYYLYARGHPRDYDEWAGLGNRGWAFEDVLPYFAKFEGFVKNESLGSTENFPLSESFGEDGPLYIIPRPFRNNLTVAFLRAGEELGYAATNPNKAGGLGFHGGHLLLRNRIRETVSESFIVRGSPSNLQVHTEATVTKILFDDDRKAVGVAYGENGEHTVKANKEVIVSAGALNTPKLLMLSGVGPVNHLQAMRIPVVAALEGVGQNLHDQHSIFHFTFSAKNETGVEFKDTLSFANMKYFIQRREGQLSRPFGLEGTASVYLGRLRRRHSVRSNVHYVFYSSMLPFVDKQSFTFPELRPEIAEEVLGDTELEKSLSLVPSLLRPRSRGWIYLKSKDPEDAPIVDFNFLSHPNDIDLMIRAIRFAFRISRTKAMQTETGMSFASKKLNSCSKFRDNSDAYWECFARHLTTSANHPMGTCKMGPETDPLSVVSDTLKVRGVSGLRVVDASVMPQGVSAPPLSTVMMIAEKAAELIMKEWGYTVEQNDLDESD